MPSGSAIRVLHLPDAIPYRLLREANLEHIDHRLIGVPAAHLGPLIDDPAVLILEHHVGERINSDWPWLRVDGSQGERPDAVVADHLDGLVDVLVGLMADHDLNVVVEPGGFSPMDRGGKFVGLRWAKLIDLDGNLEVPLTEGCDPGQIQEP